MTGEELKYYRTLRKITRRRLGVMLGYNDGRTAENMIQLFESNRRALPPKHYRKISEILDIPLDKVVP